RLELRDRAEGDGREVGVAVEERRVALERLAEPGRVPPVARTEERQEREREPGADERTVVPRPLDREDRKSTRLNSSHVKIPYAALAVPSVPTRRSSDLASSCATAPRATGAR